MKRRPAATARSPRLRRASASARAAVAPSALVTGTQKQLTFSEGVVFSSLPQFQTLQGNPSDMSVQVYGYLARRT